MQEKGVGRAGVVECTEWRALMIQQVRNLNRPSSLSPCFQPHRRQLGWLVVICRGSSWPETEQRVTTELPGNTVSNDNENDNERRGVPGNSKQW